MEEPKKRRRSTHIRIIRGGAEGDLRSERERSERYEFSDSDTASFDTAFGKVIAPHASIEAYMASEHKESGEGMIAIELGGSARALFRGMRASKFARTGGFTLLDRRTEEEKSEDAARSHDVIEADVFFNEGAGGRSWKDVEHWIHEHGKPVLIIERMVQGIDLIRRADLFADIVARWYSLIERGGTMLIEIPRPLTPDQIKELEGILRGSDHFKGCEMVIDTSGKPKVMLIRAPKEEGV